MVYIFLGRAFAIRIALRSGFVTFSFRYHGDWRSETQTAVSLLAFIHWLETGELLLHPEAEEKLGRTNFLLVFFFLFTFDFNLSVRV